MLWVRSEWDRVAGFTLAGAGAVLVVVGAFAANSASNTLDALSYIATAGLIGLLLLGVGLTLLVSASLHDEWRKLDRLESAMRGEPLPDAEEVLDLVRATNSTAEQPPSGAVAFPGAIPGRDSVTAAVALNPRWARVLPGVLLLPLATVAAGVGGATQSAQYGDSVRAVWVAFAGVVVGVGLLALHTAGLGRRVVRRRQEIVSRQRAGSGNRTSAKGDVGQSVWVVEGLRHFHRADCAAIAGVDAVRVTPDAGRSELVPCGLCEAGG